MNFSGVITIDRLDVHEKTKVRICKFEFAYGDEVMVDEVWCSTGGVPYCSSRSSVKFQGHRGQKSPILTWIGRLQFELNDGYKMMHNAGRSIEEVPYCLLRSTVKFQGPTGPKIADFHPNVKFLDCNSSLNWPMAME